MFRYFIVYKPYKTLSQFTSAFDKKTLADFFSVPKNVYPVGRLDEDSEGLLILTNDQKLNHRLLNPSFEHEREYWVQVEGAMTSEGLLILTNDVKLNHRLLDTAFENEREYWVEVEDKKNREDIIQMQQGLQLIIKGEKYQAKSSIVHIFNEAPEVAERMPPVRYRLSVETSWIKIILKEGKNRQVRKMTAHVGFPTLRLIRFRIQEIKLNDMKPGSIIELSQKSIYKKLFHGSN